MKSRIINAGKYLFSNKYRALAIMLVLMMGFLQFKSYTENRRARKVIEDYKRTIIESDVLRLEKDGVYKKIVDNLNSEKDLKKALKEQNETLSNNVKKSKSKILSLTSIIATMEKKTDTVYLDTTLVTDKDITIPAFYPNKEKWFISYKGVYNFNDNTLISSWDFTELKIDIVLTEKTKGIWETFVNGPDFLKIGKIDVKSLPEEDFAGKKEPWIRASWGLGMTTNFNPLNQQTNFKVMLGLRMKNKSLIIEGLSNKSLGVGILFDF